MAKRKQKGFQGKNVGGRTNPKKSSAAWLLWLGAAVLVLGVIVSGAFQLSGQRQATQTALQPEQVAQKTDQTSVSDTDPAQTEVDREIRYLGPETNTEGVKLAAAGKVGLPTVVWFHADW